DQAMRRLSAALAVVIAATLASAAGHAAEARMIGFYAPWDPASLASLKQHGADLQTVVPAWISVTGANHKLTVEPDPAGHASIAALKTRPKLWLMVQNAL